MKEKKLKQTKREIEKRDRTGRSVTKQSEKAGKLIRLTEGKRK